MDRLPLAEAFAGAARLLADHDDVERFVQPARGSRGATVAVVQPATVDEVREIVRRAVASGIRLLPQGANTGLVGASVPPPQLDDPDRLAVLSLDLLSGEPVIDAGGATAVVGAGTRLSTLNEAAGAHGLHLPVDLSADPAIGGMVATNTGGSRVLRYGPMRHHVLGVELVAADDDASVFGSLGALRKDSRGVDPAQLAIGSGGTMGVITRVVVALTPLPSAVTTWWLAVADPARVVELFGFLDAARPAALSAFEYVSAAALERTLAAPGAPPNPFGPVVPAGAVLAEWSFAGDHADTGVAHDVAADVDAAFSAGLVSDGRLVDDAGGWRLRHRVTDSLRTYGTVLGHDVSTPRSALMPVRDAVAAAVDEIAAGAVLCEFGHVADGGLHLNVLFPDETGPPPPEMRRALRVAIDDIVAAAGGSYSAEHGLGPVNADRWLATTPAVEQRMIAALKAVVDPHRILGHPAHPYNRLG